MKKAIIGFVLSVCIICMFSSTFSATVPAAPIITGIASDTGYSKAVGFIAARGITLGTGNGNYSPKAKLTRGQFLTMAMRAYGISPDWNIKENFATTKNTYYSGYLAAAKRLGIFDGADNILSAPDMEITCQEMFTLLYNVLKTTDKLPAVKTQKTLTDFVDVKSVNRAEAAEVLYNLLSK